MSTIDECASKAVAVYTPWTLAFYDSVVLGFSNSYIWNCRSQIILDFYNEHVSDKHLDVGVGTGYFLDKCRFPSTAPKIALFDLSPHCLATAAKRLRRFAPSCHLGSVLNVISLPGFDSIGLNYLLHCVPSPAGDKQIVFAHLKPLLNDGGALFGSTILGTGVPQNFLSRMLIKTYNARGIFNNRTDCKEDLEAMLRSHFNEYKIRIEGCVALFYARKPRPL